jgi:ADP-heptose:LPS heptosyltransferase
MQTDYEVENKAKFLIIRFSSIGDIVLTTPVVRCLKNQVEGAELHYITKPQFSGILSTNPYIDKVHTLKENFSETIAELQAEQFDYVIDLHNNLRSARITSSLKMGSFKFKKLNIQKWLLVNFNINRLPEKHIVDRYLETLTAFDVHNDGAGLDYFIPKSDEVNISELNSEFSDSGYIAFVIGAKHFTKQLPVEKTAGICNLLNLPVLLLGGKEDEEKGNQIISLVTNKASVYNTCGKYNLNQSASIVRQAKVVISHDTGLMHIAAAFKKNIISVWGNTVPAFGMYPYLPGNGSQIVEVVHLKCRPCTKIGFRECPKNHFKCMNLINEKQVADLANNLLIQ